VKANVKKFLEETFIELIENKVAIRLERKKIIKYGEGGVEKVSGFYNDEPKEFAVGMAKPQSEWLEVYAHEFCHFKQAREKVKVWTSNVSDKLDDWLEKKIMLTKSELRKVLNACKDVELDCEYRTVDMIRKYQLDNVINIERYCQKANCYVLYYNVVGIMKEWYKRPPYEFPELIDMMPKKLITNHKKRYRKFENGVIKKCY